MAAKDKNLNPCKEISNNIRKQAEALLRSKKIPSMIGELGQLYFTGSYALDLMTWNDIDMQLVVKDNISPPEAFIKILGAFMHEEGFVEAMIINFSDDYKPQMPRGHYLLL